MERRVAGRLECNTALDFNLDSCTVEHVTCDIRSDLPVSNGPRLDNTVHFK